MTSDKRDFDNFKDFDGEVNPLTGYYEFPTLYSKTSPSKSGITKIRKWDIKIRIIKESSRTENTRKINWDLMEEIQVPINPEYIQSNIRQPLPEGLIAQVWTETGEINGKITRHSASYTGAKNIGKSNFRNSLQQALIFARNKFLKKMEQGGVKEQCFLMSNKNINKIKLHQKYFPMLAKKVEDVIYSYPQYVQPKLDGVRCISYLKEESKSWEDVVLYSRQKKDYPNNEIHIEIKKQLFVLFSEFYKNRKNVIYLDGEFYKHGVNLQSISSQSRKSNSKLNNTYHLYNIYDLLSPDNLNWNFEKRLEILNKISEIYENLKFNKKMISFVPTHKIENKEEEDILYKKYITEKYEGIMIRDPNSLYATSATSKNSSTRSKYLLKRKEVFENEYEIVDFTTGKEGKEVGAIIWIGKTQDNVTFNITPNLPYTERYKLYKEACTNNGEGFIKKFKNRLLLIQYRSLSDDNVPQHAKGIYFRDFY